MWPFKRKKRQPERLPIDGPWLVKHGEYRGKPMIVRVNNGYKEYGSVAHYEYQVGIAVPLRDPEPTGLPSPSEDIELGQVEDAVNQALETQTESLLVAIITTGGMREFVFYTRDPEAVKRRFEQARAVITSHEIQLMIQQDKGWGVYAHVG
jgi:hypothetical protein